MAKSYMKIDQKLLEESRKRLQDPEYLHQIRQAMELLGIPHSGKNPLGSEVPEAEKNITMKTYKWKKTDGGYTTDEPKSGDIPGI